MSSNLSKLTLSWLTVLCALCAAAQPSVEWSYNYGGDAYEEITASVLAPGGGFLAVGSSSSPTSGSITSANSGAADLVAVRMSPDGTKIWERRIGGNERDRAQAVIVDSRDRYVIVGESRSGAVGSKSVPLEAPFPQFTSDVYVVCLDEDGKDLWQASLGGNGLHEAFGVVELDNGNYLVGGHTNAVIDGPQIGSRVEPLRGDFDFWTVELTSDGTFVREHVYGGAGREWLWGMYKLADGTIMLYGDSESSVSGERTSASYGSSDIWIVHIRQDGSIIRDFAFGGNGLEVPHFLTQLNDGDMIVASETASDVGGAKSTPARGAVDLWVVRFDPTSGAIRWDNTYGGAADDYIFTGRRNVNDHILLAGTTRSGQRGDLADPIEGEDDGWLVYIAPDGELVWDITQGGDERDNIRTLIRSENGGWYLGGESNSNPFPWRDAAAGGPYGQFFNGSRATDGWLAKLTCSFQVDLGADSLSVCAGEPVSLRPVNTRYLPNTSFLWSNGVTDSILMVTPTESENIVLRSVSPDACEGMDSVYLTAHAVPTFITLQVTPETCEGSSDGSVEVRVSGDAEELTINGTTYPESASLSNLAAQELLVVATSTAALCDVDTLLEIVAGESFMLDLGPDRRENVGTIVSLDPSLSTSGPFTYEWSGLPELCADCPTQNFELIESATITLTATNGQGCSQTDVLEIRGVTDRTVRAPNAFSPNSDGINDRFEVFASDFVAEMGNLQVFDRWGNLYYSAPGEQATQEDGWDGVLDGEPAQEGVYTYVLPVVFRNGEQRVIQGEVTLLR